MDATRRALRLLLPLQLLVVAGLMGWAVLRLDSSALGATLAQSSLWPWLPLAVLACVGGQILRGVRGRLLVGNQANLSIAAMSNISAVGYAANDLFPFRLGELARLAMLSERTGFPWAQSLTVVAIERLFDGLIVVGMLLSMGGAAPRWLLAALVAAAAALAIAVAFARLLAPMSVAVTRGRALRSAAGIAATLSALRGPRILLRLTLWSLAIWCCESLMYLVLFPAVQLQPRAPTAMAAMVATQLGLWRTVPTGFARVFQSTCAGAVQRATGDAAAAAGYALLARVAFYLPVTLWGVVAFTGTALERGVPLIWRIRSRGAAPVSVPGSPPTAERDPPAWLVAVLEAMLESPLQVPDRANVVRRAASFSHGQLLALPPLLRFGFFFGMRLFRAAVFLQHGRGITRLALDRRVRVVGRWNDGSARARRQLFRPLRATALLCFYEQPEVRAELERVPIAALNRQST